MGGAHASSEGEPMQFVTAAPAIPIDHSINCLLCMRKKQNSEAIFASGTGAGQIFYHVVFIPLLLPSSVAGSHDDLTGYYLLHESRTRNFRLQCGDLQRPIRLLVEPAFRHLKKI